MKVRTLIAMLALCGASAANAATQTIDYGSFTLAYDDSTSFANPSSSFSSGGGVLGFAWTVPNSVNVASFGAGFKVNSFDMPDFTITAKAGYSLSGLTAFIGNLTYVEVAGGLANASIDSTLTVDGAIASFGNVALSKVETGSVPGYNNGYFTDTGSVSVGTFTSLSLTNVKLNLFAAGGAEGAFAGIAANPQNELKFSLIAAAVPEPESYAMFLAGLGLIGAIARRGKQQA